MTCGSFAITALLSEAICARRELRDIPLGESSLHSAAVLVHHSRFIQAASPEQNAWPNANDVPRCSKPCLGILSASAVGSTQIAVSTKGSVCLVAWPA